MLIVHESSGRVLKKLTVSGVIGLAEHDKNLVFLKTDGSITSETNAKIDFDLAGDTVAFSNGLDDYAVSVNFDKDFGRIAEGSQVQIIKF
jgi:hypothetical protein